MGRRERLPRCGGGLREQSDGGPWPCNLRPPSPPTSPRGARCEHHHIGQVTASNESQKKQTILLRARLMAASPGGELSLRAWAAEAEAAANIAKALAPTPFIPESLRRWENPEERDPRLRRLDYEGTVATVAAVLLAGQELHFQPMASLRAFTIIKGTVAMYALAARALLQHNGHEIVVIESTSERAVVRGRRAGSEHWQQSIWDIQRARLAGLYPGSDRGNWRTQTKAMLVARATAEASRWVAADAMLGLPLFVEEVDELPDGQEPAALAPAGAAADGEAPPAAPVTRKRRTTVARAALPSAPPSSPGPPVPDPPAVNDIPAEPQGINKPTPTQMAKLHAGLRELGVDDADRGLALVSDWAGRPITSTKQLTRTEMSRVLDRIDALLADRQPPPPPEGGFPIPPPDDTAEPPPESPTGGPDDQPE